MSLHRKDHADKRAFNGAGVEHGYCNPRQGGRGSPPNAHSDPGRLFNTSRAQGNVCPCCGQPVVPTQLALPRIKSKILDAVRRRPGITATELRDIVWADAIDGGPEDRKVLHVHICQLNKLIAHTGVAVRGSISGGYRLIPSSRGRT